MVRGHDQDPAARPARSRRRRRARRGRRPPLFGRPISTGCWSTGPIRSISSSAAPSAAPRRAARARRSTGSRSTSRARPCASAATAPPGAASPAPTPARSRSRSTTRDLRSARLIGPATLDVDGARGLSVDLRSRAAARSRAAGVDADNLSLGLLGAGRLELAGTAEQLRGDVPGQRRPRRRGARAPTTRPITTDTAGTVALTVQRPGRRSPPTASATSSRRPRRSARRAAPAPAQVRCGGSDQRQRRQLAGQIRRQRREPVARPRRSRRRVGRVEIAPALVARAWRCARTGTSSGSRRMIVLPVGLADRRSPGWSGARRCGA